MKLNHLMDEMERVIDDKVERSHLLEGVLGYILCSTQVCFYFIYLLICFLPFYFDMEHDRVI